MEDPIPEQEGRKLPLRIQVRRQNIVDSLLNFLMVDTGRNSGVLQVCQRNRLRMPGSDQHPEGGHHAARIRRDALRRGRERLCLVPEGQYCRGPRKVDLCFGGSQVRH